MLESFIIHNKKEKETSWLKIIYNIEWEVSYPQIKAQQHHQQKTDFTLTT